MPAAAAAITLVACGNISLTNGSEATPSGGAGFFAAADASTDAQGGGASVSIPPAGVDAGDVIGSGTAPFADAGVASPTVGSWLCNYSYDSDAGAHVCQPDTSSQCPSVDAPGAPGDWDAGEDGGPACRVTVNGQKCDSAGPGGDGAQCLTSKDCAVSFECVGSPGQCRHYCCSGNSTCDQAAAAAQTAGPTFCDVQTTTDGAQSVPVCEPVTNCTPLLTGSGAGTCADGYTCAVVKDDGTTSCVEIGTVGIGGDCSQLHCRAELTCLGDVGSRKCFELCQESAPACSQGSCMSSAQLFTNANVGICQ